MIIKKFKSLFTDPIFLWITFAGNSLVLLTSFFLYKVEFGTNPMLKSFLDALWWGYSTITTVGYGDVHPVTALGKIIGICLMLAGSSLFATYTAIFINIIFGEKIIGIRSNLKKVEQEIETFQEEVERSEEEVIEVILKMQNELKKIEKFLNKKKGDA